MLAYDEITNSILKETAEIGELGKGIACSDRQVERKYCQGQTTDSEGLQTTFGFIANSFPF